MAPLFEGHMATFRLTYHLSILSRLMHEACPPGNAVLRHAISFAALAQRELLASSVTATSHCIALWRAMVLGPLDYTPKAKQALIAMPFEGGSITLRPLAAIGSAARSGGN